MIAKNISLYVSVRLRKVAELAEMSGFTGANRVGPLSPSRPDSRLELFTREALTLDSRGVLKGCLERSLRRRDHRPLVGRNPLRGMPKDARGQRADRAQ